MAIEKFSVTTLVALMVVGVVLIIFMSSLIDSSTREDKTSSPLFQIQAVTVRHHYSEGEHRYSGSINVPTPCHSLVSQAIVHPELDPDEAVLNLTTPVSKEKCEQKITLKMFLITFKAEARTLVAATLNGKKILLDTVEVENKESVVLIQ